MDEQKKIPRHVAIIMDGNGRWAERRKLPRKMGQDVYKRHISNRAEIQIRSMQRSTMTAAIQDNIVVTAKADILRAKGGSKHVRI